MTPAPLTKEDPATALGEAASGPKATGPMKDGTGATLSGGEYTGSGIHSIQLSLTRLRARVVPMQGNVRAAGHGRPRRPG